MTGDTYTNSISRVSTKSPINILAGWHSLRQPHRREKGMNMMRYYWFMAGFISAVSLFILLTTSSDKAASNFLSWFGA